jgi:hypothetical protein
MDVIDRRDPFHVRIQANALAARKAEQEFENAEQFSLCLGTYASTNLKRTQTDWNGQ